MTITFGQRVAMGLRIGLLGWLLTPALSCWAAEYTWDGGGSDDNWSTGENWVDDVAPSTSGDRLFFDGTARVTPNAETAYAVDSLVFSSTTNYTVSGGALTITPSSSTNGIMLHHAGAQIRRLRIDNDIVIGANASFRTMWDGVNNIATRVELRGKLNIQNYDLTLALGRYTHGYELYGEIEGTGTLLLPTGQLFWHAASSNFSGTVSGGSGHTLYNDNSWGTGPVLMQSGATATVTASGGARTLANNITISATGNGLSWAGNDFTFNGSMTLQSHATTPTRRMNAVAPNQTITVNGDVGQSTATAQMLRIAGTNGTSWVFNGDATYTGATRVEAITTNYNTTAYFNGDFSSSSSFLVHTNQTLRGTGKVSTVTVNVNGRLAPGGKSAIGTLEAAGDVTLENDSLFRINIGVGANESDRLQITGGNSFTLGTGVTLELLGTLDGSSTYTLATYGDLSGTFATVLLNGSAQDFTDSGYSVTYGTDSMTLAIPEPGTLGLLLGAGLLLALRRRRAAAACVPCGNAANN